MDEEEKRMLFNEINILKEIVSPNLFAITAPDLRSVRGLLFGQINATNPENKLQELSRSGKIPSRSANFDEIFQDHPNIVKMYEFFEDEKRYYLVTE